MTIQLSSEEATALFREAPDRHIDVGNGSVSYRKIGSGPDVLFSHGWPVNAATFRGLLPHLASHVTCHLVDLPGAGQSMFDRSMVPSISTHADALRHVVDELGLERFGIVGHDSGGMIARFAFAGDDRVHGWGLIATEQPPKASRRFSSFLLVRHIPRFESLLAHMVNRPAIRRNKFVLGDAFADKNHLNGAFDEFNLRPLLDDAERRWAAGEFGRNFDLDLFADLTACHQQMTAPVQLVWGGEDPFFPVARTREMMDDFAGPVALEVIDEAKLFVHEEFPERTALAIRATIAGQGAQ